MEALGFQACRARPGKAWANAVWTSGAVPAALIARLAPCLLGEGRLLEVFLCARATSSALRRTRLPLRGVALVIFVLAALGFPAALGLAPRGVRSPLRRVPGRPPGI